LHPMAYLVEHSADLAVAALMERNLVPRVLRFARQRDFRGRGFHAATALIADADSGAQFRDVRLERLAADFYQVSLGNVRGGAHQLIANVPSLVSNSRPSEFQSSLPTGYSRAGDLIPGNKSNHRGGPSRS